MLGASPLYRTYKTGRDKGRGRDYNFLLAAIPDRQLFTLLSCIIREHRHVLTKHKGKFAQVLKILSNSPRGTNSKINRSL